MYIRVRRFKFNKLGDQFINAKIAFNLLNLRNIWLKKEKINSIYY